jgi:hypothetical protein
MTTTTTDGCLITTIEQEGNYAGEDIGKLWIHGPQRWRWAWYGSFASLTARDAAMAVAQTMTAMAFDAWFAMTGD